MKCDVGVILIGTGGPGGRLALKVTLNQTAEQGVGRTRTIHDATLTMEHHLV